MLISKDNSPKKMIYFYRLYLISNKMDEISELSEVAKDILRDHIHFQKQKEYDRGVIIGLLVGAFICAGTFVIFKLKQ